MTRRLNIRIDNRNKKFRLNEVLLKRAALEVLKDVRMPRLAELEIILLSDRAIRPLNKKYKDADRPTDVLSFNIDACEFGRGKCFGEIFISTDMALKNSKAYGTTFENELALYIIHGILHLSGYEDYTAKDKLRMSKKQEIILERLCKKIDLSRALIIR
jgi:probable rRNA maturation factor